MAEQEGVLPYSGKLGDTVGYRRGKKHFKRAKPASYQPGEESQKSSAEFRTGSKACAILKQAIKPLILKHFRLELHNRLSAKLREIIRTGPIDKKGKRGVLDGDLKLLKVLSSMPKQAFISSSQRLLISKLPQQKYSSVFPLLTGQISSKHQIMQKGQNLISALFLRILMLLPSKA
ncbi:hypothetical protein [Pedobacter alpinus]|uniref:Uncharacterized protein n=1 Tax=Pedobacter alpinus TaxID=1590643 RepID=A0ABW5TUE6_9SPHI